MQAKKEEDEFDAVMPIFVCTLAFPGIPCPLHIFEPRYRLMVRRCMESGKQTFGMCVYVDHNGRGGYSDVGTALRIRSFQTLPDGRSLIDTVGTSRFRVLERSERDGYNVARVEFIEDVPIVDEDRLEECQRLMGEIQAILQSWRSSLRYILSGLRQLVAVLSSLLSCPVFSLNFLLCDIV